MQIEKGRKPVLKDLKVRPAISSKKISGYLECHKNGFKYNSLKSENIEVIFKNIKHAFFQPCDYESIICIHFNLFNPIFVGKKKSNDI